MQQMHGHTLKAFDRDLAELRGLISDMGSFAEAAIDEAMRCLVEHDVDAARELVEADVQLDELETEAERRVLELIALRIGNGLAEIRDAVLDKVELQPGHGLSLTESWRLPPEISEADSQAVFAR